MEALSIPNRIWIRATAAGVFACLLSARFLLDATPQTVFVFGHALHFECLVKQLLGVPCPACGMTRSVVMTLHGDVAAALAINPAGVLFAVGVAMTGVALAAVSVTGRGGALSRRFFVSYGSATAAVLIAHWIAVLFAK